MLNLIKPRHLNLLKKHLKKDESLKKREECEPKAVTPSKKTQLLFKKLHYNATRTKVTQFWIIKPKK